MRTYEKQAQAAQRAIEKNGSPVTFYTEAVAGGVDPNTGMPTTGTPRVEKTGNGLVFGYKAGEIDGVSIQKQDAYVLYVGEKPELDMYFDQGNGKKWQVKYVDVLAPTSVNILYKVQVR
jgi:hypothetical protein